MSGPGEPVANDYGRNWGRIVGREPMKISDIEPLASRKYVYIQNLGPAAILVGTGMKLEDAVRLEVRGELRLQVPYSVDYFAQAVEGDSADVRVMELG